MILMTYLMALLILVGAALVGLSKFLQWRKQLPYRQKEEQEDIERSTLQFKQELERSGSEIIGRLGEHVERLEALIREADRRADTLDHRLTELHTLSQSLDAQTEELRAAEQEARREQQFVSQLMGELRAAAAGAATARGAALPAPVERVDADDFTSVLRHSIARDEERQLEGRTAPATYRASSEAIQQAAHLAQAVHPKEAEDTTAPQGEESVQDTSASAAHVRALLLAGWSPADVARETGVGRGAIELMQEMMRRQLVGSDG